MVLRYRLDIAPQHLPQARYVFRTLFEGLGVPSREVPDTDQVDLLYSSTRPTDGAVWIRHQPGQSDWSACALKRGQVGRLPALLPSGGSGTTDCSNGLISGDLIAAAFTVLSGRAEQTLPTNEYGVPELQDGYYVNALLSHPIVSEYAAMLGVALHSRWAGYSERETMWPGGATWAMLLTHDVDMPYKHPTFGFYTRRAWSEIRRARIMAAARSLAIGATWSALTGPTRPATDPRFGFKYWSDAAAAGHFPNTIYVASTSASRLDADPLDVGYDLHDPGMKDALRAFADAGGEIGLHASLWAREEWSRLREERERLEDAVPGLTVEGVRHHYWALDPDRPERTWRAQAAASLTYDSSLGMNNSAGFRRGMAWPFQPYDHHYRSRVGLLQIPPTCMDGAVMQWKRGERESQLRDHLCRIEKVGGVAVFNWHLEQSDPRRLDAAGPLLARLVKTFADREDIYRATPREMARWWNERSARIAERARGRSKITLLRTGRKPASTDAQPH